MIQWKDIVELLIYVRRIRNELLDIQKLSISSAEYYNVTAKIENIENELDNMQECIDKLSLLIR